MELFFQVFDKGMLEDGEGREIDFKNTVILLTSNVGTDTIMSAVRGPGDAARARARWPRRSGPSCCKHFPPAFLGRLIVVPYYPISAEIMRADHRGSSSARIQARVRENHARRARLRRRAWSTRSVARCTEVESGARNVDHILTRTLLPEISREVLGAHGRAARELRRASTVDRDHGRRVRASRYR